MAGTFLEIGRNDPCWCGSAHKYKRCHGKETPSYPPGAPVPPDRSDGTIFISPDTAVHPDVLAKPLKAGAPIYIPGSREHSRPEPVATSLLAHLKSVPRRSPTISLEELGKLRFEILASHGITANRGLEDTISKLPDKTVDELRYSVFDIARATVERLLEIEGAEDPPAVVSAESVPATQLIGQTLLWADHYLVPDEVASVLASESVDRENLFRALSGWFRDKPLISIGMEVPVMRDLAVILTHDLVLQRTERQLENEDLLRWVDSQILVEGPSAREVIFMSAKDDLEQRRQFYLYGRILRDAQDELHADESIFTTRLLGTYDPDHDYGPWIAQSRRQTGARLIQEAVRNITVAEALGATHVTNSPFRARLLDQIGSNSPIATTFWADVPTLPQASPNVLVEIAGQQEAVSQLRRTVGRTIARIQQADSMEQVRAVRDLVAEVDDRAKSLAAEIRNDANWDRFEGGLAIGAVALGALSGGVLGAATAGLGAASVLARSLKRKSAIRRNDAYVFWLAERRLRRSRGDKP